MSRIKLINLPNWCDSQGLHNGDVFEALEFYKQPDQSVLVKILCHGLHYYVHPEHYQIIEETIEINELLDLI